MEEVYHFFILLFMVKSTILSANDLKDLILMILSINVINNDQGSGLLIFKIIKINSFKSLVLKIVLLTIININCINT